MTAGRSFTREEQIPAGRDAPFVLVVISMRPGRVCLAAIRRLSARHTNCRIAGRRITVVGIASPLVDMPHERGLLVQWPHPPQDVAHVTQRRRAAEAGRHHRAVIRRAGNAAMKQLGKTVPERGRTRVGHAAAVHSTGRRSRPRAADRARCDRIVAIRWRASTSRICCWRAVSDGRAKWRCARPSAPVRAASFANC